MRNVQIDYRSDALNFQSARLIAISTARDNKMQDPTIMAWHQNGDQATPPIYDGADADSWWAKYGAGNGGRLEVCVGEEYQFIMMDARAYETLGVPPLRNLSDNQGNPYLCYAPMNGAHSDAPDLDACTLLDGWAADQH